MSETSTTESSTWPSAQNLSARLDKISGDPTAELTPEDQRRWAMAFASMPFAGGLSITNAPKTFADVTLMLGRLAARLADHGEAHAQLESDHWSLRSDVAAMRRVLGVSA